MSSSRSSSARRSAAARNIPSVISRASATRAPRPTPGKTKTLLPCPMRRVRPPWTTAGKGLPVEARPLKRLAHEAGDADAGRSRAQDDDPVPRQRHPEKTRRGQDPRQRDRRRALDVVVEGRQDLAIPVEEGERRALPEVLPLEH